MANYLEQTLVRAGFDSAADAGDDRPFRHYSARHRIISWVSSTLFDGMTYTVRRGLLRGMKRKGGLAWLPERLSRMVETPEEHFWRGLHLSGLVVYDVGAFHGLLSLFFARSCRQVISYEPNSRNRQRLTDNVALNSLGNVLIRPVGLGARRASVTMMTPLTTPGGATTDVAAVAELRRSQRPTSCEEIWLTTLDQDIREFDLPAPDLIKIDVEGGEMETLTGACDTLLRHRPQLFIEIHGETMKRKRRNVAAVLEYLQALGYHDIRHVESNVAIDRDNSHLAARGHLFCRYASSDRLANSAGA